MIMIRLKALIEAFSLCIIITANTNACQVQANFFAASKVDKSNCKSAEGRETLSLRKNG